MEGAAFHCHHKQLAEWVHNYDERVDYIKKMKPQSEVGLRLKLFKMIPKDRVPEELLKARVECDKARVEWDKARVKWDKARVEWNPELIKLHEELCPDCPFDGTTIFTRKNNKGEWY